MLTTVRHIFGRIMHSETALCSQWDKGWKNNLLFASPSIRRPTLRRFITKTNISQFFKCTPLYKFFVKKNNVQDTLLYNELAKTHYKGK